VRFGELLEELETLKRRRSLHDDEARIRLLDVAIERLAVNALIAGRERLSRDLEIASANVRRLQAQVHAARIVLRERSEACKDPDEAKRLLAQVERWSASSLPTCVASPEEIQASRRCWLQQLEELLH
jgi:hypothetical protein